MQAAKHASDVPDTACGCRNSPFLAANAPYFHRCHNRTGCPSFCFCLGSPTREEGGGGTPGASKRRRRSLTGESSESCDSPLSDDGSLGTSSGVDTQADDDVVSVVAELLLWSAMTNKDRGQAMRRSFWSSSADQSPQGI